MNEKWPLPNQGLKAPLICLSQRLRVPTGDSIPVRAPFSAALKASYPGISPCLYGNPSHLIHTISRQARQIVDNGAIAIFEGIGNRNPNDISTERLFELLRASVPSVWKQFIPVLCINSVHTHAYTRDTAHCPFKLTHPNGPEEIRRLAVSRGWPHTFCEEHQLADELTRVLMAIRDGQLAQFR